MMKILLAAPIGALLLAACADYGVPPSGVDPGRSAVGPQQIRFTGRILDRDGRCNTIRSLRTGRLYSVRAAALGNYAPGTRVRVNGMVAGPRGCPHPLIRIRRLRQV
jgi:hypothetical protein